MFIQQNGRDPCLSLCAGGSGLSNLIRLGALFQYILRFIPQYSKLDDTLVTLTLLKMTHNTISRTTPPPSRNPTLNIWAKMPNTGPNPSKRTRTCANLTYVQNNSLNFKKWVKNH